MLTGMRGFMLIAGIAAFLIGAWAASLIRSDIQLIIALVSFLASVIMFGIAAVLGQLEKLRANVAWVAERLDPATSDEDQRTS
jgi:uncharacterized membrane protein